MANEIHHWRRARPTEELKNDPVYRRFMSREEKLCELAEGRTCLWHYTNVDSLFKILSNRTIRFTRIDNVNDLTEKEAISAGNYFLKTYVACFCHCPTESIPLWKGYTKEGQGVRIEFDFVENNIQNHIVGPAPCSKKVHNKQLELSDFICSMHDIDYLEERYPSPIEERMKGEGYDVDTDEVAIRKNKVWEYENETRIVMLLLSVVDDETPPYIDFLIDFSKFKRITVTFDPYMSEEIKKSVELTSKYYLNDYERLIVFKDSDLQGKIR